MDSDAHVRILELVVSVKLRPDPRRRPRSNVAIEIGTHRHHLLRDARQTQQVVELSPKLQLVLLVLLLRRPIRLLQLALDTGP